MEINYTVKSENLGKYAGKCKNCQLMRGTDEHKGMRCHRCGEEFADEPIHLDIEGNPKS